MRTSKKNLFLTNPERKINKNLENIKEPELEVPRF
jgi:hypothetical protein